MPGGRPPEGRGWAARPLWCRCPGSWGAVTRTTGGQPGVLGCGRCLSLCSAIHQTSSCPHLTVGGRAEGACVMETPTWAGVCPISCLPPGSHRGTPLLFEEAHAEGPHPNPAEHPRAGPTPGPGPRPPSGFCSASLPHSSSKERRYPRGLTRQDGSDTGPTHVCSPGGGPRASLGCPGAQSGSHKEGVRTQERGLPEDIGART